MKITKEWLIEWSACVGGIKWFEAQKETQGKKLAIALMVDKKLQWTNWLLVRLMTHKQQIKYTIYAAELVIKNYEDKYPEDKRPREAIEAAKAYMERPTEENKSAAWSAAWSAASAESAARSAAWSAAASAAASAESEKILKQILDYGLKLLEEK
jgi:hypothetical protein